MGQTERARTQCKRKDATGRGREEKEKAPRTSIHISLGPLFRTLSSHGRASRRDWTRSGPVGLADRVQKSTQGGEDENPPKAEEARPKPCIFPDPTAFRKPRPMKPTYASIIGLGWIFAHPCCRAYTTCREWRDSGGAAASGIYPLSVGGTQFDVYCDMHTMDIQETGGWTLVSHGFANG